MSNTTKICTKCNIAKLATLEFFYSCKGGRYGLKSVCKACLQVPKKDLSKRICSHCKDEFPWNGQHFHKNRRYLSGFNGICKRCVRAQSQQRKNQTNEYWKQRRKDDPDWQLKKNLSSRISMAIVNQVKSEDTFDLLGCDIDHCRKYLENLFTDEMSWDNYGNPNGDHSDCWHIDHIIPCSFFDLTKESHRRACFHYTNIQPMWSKENISKGDTVDISSASDMIINLFLG